MVIGAPTLRLRGDYLAIVTLGFGEIFRIAMGNLDGTSGPDITNGPNGIPNIPHLEIFGWNFGESHIVAGIELGAYANYYFLMLLVMALVVLVFARAGNSRIGRAWVAIREDETAAEAMGINGFKVKLIAFALGATLAGLAGTVQAHVNTTVVPENYVFAGPVPPNSAFLLAAVILGGMGTIRGPILGAALLFLIPAKLAFLQDYQLLAFGIALILLMRFRPEGSSPTSARSSSSTTTPLTRPPRTWPPPRRGRERHDDHHGHHHHDHHEDHGPRSQGRHHALRRPHRRQGRRPPGQRGRDRRTHRPNGAGKTTFFNCLTGLYVPTEGSVSYKGKILPPKPHRVTEAGIARTFQNIRLFHNMTVLENVLVGRHTRTKEGLWSALLRGPGFKKAEAASEARAMELLEFIGLEHKADHLAKNLPTANSASWRSPAPSPATPASSSWTSPPPA